MQAILEYLFGAASFVPHGFCLLWRPDLVALHGISDLVTAVAYFAISAGLFVFARRRRDLQFRWLFGLFVAFILACGTTHLLDLVTLWLPAYGLQGLVKAITALFSAVTAMALWPMIPRALALPSPTMLRVANQRLEAEAATRGAAEVELREAYADLERRIEERTRALAESNASLQAEATERRRAAAHLHEREARLQAILDTAPEGILVIDAQGMVESFNPAAEALFGYAATEILGHNVKLLMPAPDQGAHDGYLARYLRTGERRIIGIGRVVKGRRKDGSEFPLELGVGEVAGKGHLHFVGFIRDLTAKESMEAELRQAQKMEAVGQLTGGIAHDFNNLLTVVLGNLELLEERLTDEADRLLVNDAVDAGHIAAQLTGRLLAFARRQPLQAQPLDLRHQVEQIAGLLRRTLGETIQVRTAAPDDLPPVLADAGQLQNAVLNLALNARDAMPKGGILMLRTEAVAITADDAALHADDLKPGCYLLLSVTDTGAGMPPEVREHAFEPFFTTKAAGSGSGLGLAMVYGFALQSGGQTRIYSEPGHGTTVRLYLPQAKQAPPVVAKPLAVIPGTFPGRGETILVTEDEALVRRYVVKRLIGLGYRVLEAENGPMALQVLEQAGPVDLLFTDIVMPGGMTGIDLADQVSRRWPRMRVVFTSAYAEPELQQRGLTGESLWLRKPHVALDLARILRQALDIPTLHSERGNKAQS